MDRSATYWMQQPLRKYATFEGRARRAEYWWFALAYFIVLAAAAIVDGVIGMTFGGLGGPLYALVFIGGFVPSLAVAVRRLHDLDKSGWWYLIVFVPLVGGIVLLVWFCTQGISGPNRYGSDPLAGDVAEVFS